SPVRAADLSIVWHASICASGSGTAAGGVWAAYAAKFSPRVRNTPYMRRATPCKSEPRSGREEQQKIHAVEGQARFPRPLPNAAAVVQTISGAINPFWLHTSYSGGTRAMFDLAPAVFGAHESCSLHRTYIRCTRPIFAAREPFSTHQISCQPLANL